MFQLRQVSLDTTVSWSLDFFLLTRLWYKNAQETDPIKTQELLYRRQSSGPDPNWKDQILPSLSSEKKKLHLKYVETCYDCFLFLPQRYAWAPPPPCPLFFFLFLTCYLNCMYTNVLVTCVGYNKVTMKVTDTDTATATTRVYAFLE